MAAGREAARTDQSATTKAGNRRVTHGNRQSTEIRRYIVHTVYIEKIKTLLHLTRLESLRGHPHILPHCKTGDLDVIRAIQVPNHREPGRDERPGSYKSDTWHAERQPCRWCAARRETAQRRKSQRTSDPHDRVIPPPSQPTDYLTAIPAEGYAAEFRNVRLPTFW